MSISAISKRMRTGVVLLCGAVLAVAPLMAQQDAATTPRTQQDGPPPPPGGPGGRQGMNPERRLERMQKELNLTPDQATQVKGIFDEGRGKMEELRANTSMSQDERRPKMMEIMRQQSEKIKAILTPEQKTKFEAMEARMREHMMERRQGGEGTPPPPPPQ